jgi:hypothetical protein
MELRSLRVSEAIIEAVAVEKSYPQPDGTRIQVLGTTNLASSRARAGAEDAPLNAR